MLTVRDSVKSIEEGRFWDCYFHRITGGVALTAGCWYDTSMLAGHFGANPYVGDMLKATRLNYKNIGNLWHGENVSPMRKYLFSLSLMGTTTTAYPSQLILCDYLMFYPLINLDSTDEQLFDNTVTLPRYQDGIGVKAFLVVTIEAGPSQVGMAMSYVNQNGEEKTVPYTLQLRPSSIVTQIPHTGTFADQYGPFIPLAQGDSGIQRVLSVTLDAGMGAGYATLILCRPLISIPYYHYFAVTEYNNLIDKMNTVEIADEAYLGFLLFAGAAVAAGTRFIGYMQFIWN